MFLVELSNATQHEQNGRNHGYPSISVNSSNLLVCWSENAHDADIGVVAVLIIRKVDHQAMND